MEATQASNSSEWIKQVWGIDTMEYYSAIKEKKILLFVPVWVNPENFMQSEISQSEKDKYHMISLLCLHLGLSFSWLQANFVARNYYLLLSLELYRLYILALESGIDLLKGLSLFFRSSSVESLL